LIIGNGTLNKTGLGILVLSKNNTYSGGTTISDGTLIVDNGFLNGSATGSGSVTIENGGTLGGDGTIAGAVVANAGATIYPGADLSAEDDTMLALGSLTTNAGCTLAFNLSEPKTDTEDSYNDLIAANTLTFNGGTLEFYLDIQFEADTLGYFTIMAYVANNPNGCVGLSNLTLPATVDGISYALSTREENGLGLVDVHRRFAGDIDGDGIVDLADLTILARNWKKPGTWATGDLNGDGFVDLADLTILARNWKKVIHDDYLIYLDDLSWADAMASVTFGDEEMSSLLHSLLSFGPSSTVPKLASLTLLGLGGCGLGGLTLRRRRR